MPYHRFSQDIEDKIRDFTRDGMNTRQIYMLLNLEVRIAGKKDIISRDAVYRKAKRWSKLYRSWEAQLLPHEHLFREATKGGVPQ